MITNIVTKKLMITSISLVELGDFVVWHFANSPSIFFLLPHISQGCAEMVLVESRRESLAPGFPENQS